MEHTPWSYREGNRVVALPRPVYAAVQRALANMLAGREAPLEETIEAINWEYGTHVQLMQVMEPLADYVHLLVRQLPSIPASVEAMLATRTEQLREHIVEERLKLHQLQQAEEEPLCGPTRPITRVRGTSLPTPVHRWQGRTPLTLRGLHRRESRWPPQPLREAPGRELLASAPS
jgi:hypothetical protein